MQATQAPTAPHRNVPPSFMIPSIHDGIELECRVYHPANISSNQGAIFAHPYGPLGGSFDDGVVHATVATFLSEGYIVGTFNFRGAGASKGRTSWSGKPEIADYTSFIGFFLLYLRYFQQSNPQTPSQALNAAGTDLELGSKTLDAKSTLVLGGYSYGAMLTVELPPMKEVTGQFKSAAENSIESQLEQQAYHQAERQKTNLPMERARIEDVHLSVPNVSYFLVSPLLPPVSWAIAMPLPKFGIRPHHGHGVSTAATGATQSTKKLYQCRTLATYSDNDQFTGIKKLRKWSADLQSHDKSQFRCFEVAGAGHFWVSEGALDALQSRLREWLRS